MHNRHIHTLSTPPSTNRGLTLIELLVAISILGIIAVLGWRGLDSIVRTRIALNENLEQTRGMQLTFAQLESDCAHIAPAAILKNRMPLLAEQGKLRLVRVVFADNQPSRLQVVTYRHRDGKLTRHESSTTRDLLELDALWLASAKTTDDTDSVVLQTGITAMAMRLWLSSSNGWLTPADVLKRQSPSAPAALQSSATGLEISLELAGHNTRLTKIFLLGAM